MEKYQDCFIDEKGGIYKGKNLRRAAQNLPIIDYEINLEALLEESIYWQIKSFRDYLAHYRRVSDADLSKPLILRSDGYIMDGWHRIIKAIYLGKKSLPAQKFIIDPKPDSTI